MHAGGTLLPRAGLEQLPNVLITGTPGTGKTTTAERVAAALQGLGRRARARALSLVSLPRALSLSAPALSGARVLSSSLPLPPNTLAYACTHV